MMTRKLLFVIPLALMIAACSSTDEEGPLASGSGGVGGAGASGAAGGSGGPGGSGDFSSYPAGGAGGGSYGGSSAAAAQVQAELVQVGDRVFFGYDQYTLDSEAQAILERQAALLNSQPALTFVIEGHADERGTREYNLALGERRANSVKDFLIGMGIQPDRLRAVSFGEERPAVVGAGEDIWSQNRRAVTVVVGSAAGS
jgi:peptidoglycan-associated lipoprotein